MRDMYRRRRPSFSFLKFTVEVLTTILTLVLFFVVRWFSSPLSGEPVTLFEYVLSLVPYVLRA